MANLLDTIRQNSSQLATEQQGVTDETGKLQRLLRAKSGKSVGPSDASPTNLAEQSAVAQTNTTMQQQILPQAQIQQAGIDQASREQSQQLSQQKSEIDQARKFDNIQNKLKTDQLLRDLERDRGNLDLAKDRARLEQATAQMRFQNKQYLDQLQREGQRARLNNQLQFNEALAGDAFGANKELLEKQLGNQSVLRADDRAWKKAAAQMDVNMAYDMFRDDMSAAKERNRYAGIGALATAGVGAYGTLSEDKKDGKK